MSANCKNMFKFILLNYNYNDNYNYQKLKKCNFNNDVKSAISITSSVVQIVKICINSFY